jgi:hypothetical protein
MSPERARPLSPKEVSGEKLKNLPDVVIETFNQLIAENDVGGHSVITQKEIVALLVNKGLNKAQIFKNGWLDIEDIYRKAGWKVEYDKPGYNEDYDAFFTFSAKKK